MILSRRVLLGFSAFTVAVGIVVASSRTQEKTVQTNYEHDKNRCAEVTQKIIELNKEHIDVLERNGNDPKSPEAVQFREKMMPYLIEYGQIHRRHPEWEGRPFTPNNINTPIQ